MTSFKKQLAAFSQVSLFGCGVKSCSSNPRFTWFEGGHCPIIPKAVGSWQKANLSGSPLKGASSKKQTSHPQGGCANPFFYGHAERAANWIHWGETWWDTGDVVMVLSQPTDWWIGWSMWTSSHPQIDWTKAIRDTYLISMRWCYEENRRLVGVVSVFFAAFL